MFCQIMEVLAVLAFVSIMAEMRQLDLAESGVHFIMAVWTVEFVKPRE